MPAETDEGLRVGVLGPLRAWRGPVEIALGPARQRAIFAVLAVNAGHQVSRAELIAAVWGESPPASVEGSVHTYVSGLRRALEPQRTRWSAASVLVSESTGYSLRLAPDALDAAVFEQLRERARQHAEAGDHRSAVSELNSALALWQGEALSGVPGAFAERRREHFAELRLDTLERRAEAVLALGGNLDLAAELEVLTRDHPLRESLRESQMLALYRSGRPADALDVFRDTRVTLMGELGVEPGAALQQLQGQILAQDPALDLPSARPTVPAQVSRALHDADPPTALFGRETAAARLRELLAGVRAGRGRAVWVEGEAGIGKSELLTSTLADAGRHGCQLAWVAADELSMRFPLQVMLDGLAIDAKSPDPRRARVATELNGERPARRGWGESDPMLGAVDRLLSLVDELCTEAPLVLVVDDLQWADESSLLVWHRLCAATRQLPLLLVAASRPAPARGPLAP
ncbi:BTAD domain-containing putative transcriptional regulator, partial [Amycolatopsis sp. H20-H5]|uniref:BTAD domain-containing putative transcriptional regulator n=1 Tax=Amycolatopsis sp. H20-H5 TaxID=3046309 RepID=UPI002DBFBDBE